MKPLAVVILNYNGERVLPVFLPSVVAESKGDVWVIDNASGDGSLDLLARDFPSVGLIRLKENFGFAGGYNWGLEELKGQYQTYILLNSDVEVSSGWDLALHEWLMLRSDFACVQPKILSWGSKSYFDYAGAGGGYVDSFGYPYCRGRIWNHLEQDSGQYDDAELVVDWSSGACMAIRADVFHSLNGFDAHFFAHMEEVELCWRLRAQKYLVGYCGQISVFHQGGATLQRSSPGKLYLNIRNSLSMLYKNQSNFRFLLSFCVKAVLEFLAALAYLLTGRRELAGAILRGYRDFFRLKNNLEKPRLLQAAQSTGPASWILWDFFLLRRKVFGEL